MLGTYRDREKEEKMPLCKFDSPSLDDPKPPFLRKWKKIILSMLQPPLGDANLGSLPLAAFSPSFFLSPRSICWCRGGVGQAQFISSRASTMWT